MRPVCEPVAPLQPLPGVAQLLILTSGGILRRQGRLLMGRKEGEGSVHDQGREEADMNVHTLSNEGKRLG